MVPLRVPPGRTGRLWLRERVAVANRAADVLEEKRRVLLRASLGLREQADETRRRWEVSCRLAETWHLRAALVGGERQFHAASAYSHRPAEARIAWRVTMGLAYPGGAECLLGDTVDMASLGDTAALHFDAEAHRSALEAAVAYAAAQRAADLISSELELTTHRLRAIERRWIPRLETALREVGKRLDEREREEVVRARWAQARLEAAGHGSSTA
jgi:V/A-type H+-transporting ATPase subunit D